VIGSVSVCPSIRYSALGYSRVSAFATEPSALRPAFDSSALPEANVMSEDIVITMWPSRRP
jgi:hypothetical protein